MIKIPWWNRKLVLLISFLSWDLQPHSALNWSCIFSVNFCDTVRTVIFFGLILRKSTLFLRRGNKNTIVSVLRHFTCELCPCELYPVILTCERYTFISRLSSPSSLETSAPWKKMEKKNIVIRGGWLWKATNIKYKNHSARVYVGSSLKVHNPLFSVCKLRRSKLMRRFYWSVRSKC